MYQDFYNLHALPFELTPNPRFLYFTPRHREALSNVKYGLSARKGLTVLIGEAGTGKTTLLRAALESPECRDIQTVSVNNPTLTRAEFVEFLARGFGLSEHASRSKAALLLEMQQMLAQGRMSGHGVALVVDEAQRLSDELLEEIRLLANIETAEEKLLPLVLTGQPELADRLNTPSLRQLKQRVSLRCEVSPFDLSETAAYIATRIRVAGGEPVKLFTREAITLIHERSKGIPRTLNVICDNALLGGFGLGTRPVTRQMVEEVCRDFDLDAATSGQLLGRRGEETPPSDAEPADATETGPAEPRWIESRAELPEDVGGRTFSWLKR